jgi:hypothetical protein
MYTLNTIKVQVKYSATSGRVILSQTVLNAISSLKEVRPMMSAGDVAYIINNNVIYGEDKVTEAQVERTMKHLASEMTKGYRYNALRGKITQTLYGYQWSR